MYFKLAGNWSKKSIKASHTNIQVQMKNIITTKKHRFEMKILPNLQLC